MAERGRLESLGDRLVRRVLPRTPDFGPLLVDQAELVVEALTALARFCESGEPQCAERVTALEKTGDRLRERNERTLERAFSTPFDRNLTAQAIQRIDDVANYAKTTVREMQVLDLQPDEGIGAIARDLLAGGQALRLATLALDNGPGAVSKHVRVVHKRERDVEKRYRAELARLFPADPSELLHGGEDEALEGAIAHLLDAIRRREVYRHLSNAADRLDAAGHVLNEMSIASV